MRITPMQAGDIPAILALEAGALSAWDRQQLEVELQQEAGFQFVARNEGSAQILAFLCGRVMADEAEILKLHVAENARRTGIGSRLLEFGLHYCSKEGVKSCYLELRASNTAAMQLYEQQGFSRVGSRRDYYGKPREDAILMQCKLQ